MICLAVVVHEGTDPTQVPFDDHVNVIDKFSLILSLASSYRSSRMPTLSSPPFLLRSSLVFPRPLKCMVGIHSLPHISTTIYCYRLGGFGTAQAASATAVLAAVKQVLAAHSITHVTLVGHSLGAAISTIDGIYLKLALPSTTTFKHVLHGSPRVGNQQFADYIDANVCFP